MRDQDGSGPHQELDGHHLVFDGYDRPLIAEACWNDPNVDFRADPTITTWTHRDMVARVLPTQAGGRAQPYHVGVFGFLSTEAHRAVLDTVIREGFTGRG
jgi:hypothetical protein